MERATSPDGSNSGSGHSSADSESSTPLHLYTSIISLMDISNKVTGAETYPADQIVCTSPPVQIKKAAPPLNVGHVCTV